MSKFNCIACDEKFGVPRQIHYKCYAEMKDKNEKLKEALNLAEGSSQISPSPSVQQPHPRE